MIRMYLKKAKWLLLAGWIVFVYASYLHFWRDNVFWAQTILWKSLGEIFFRIFLLILFLLIATALGKRIFKWLDFESGSFLESLLFSLATGLAIFTYLIIGFGLIGILNRWAINLLLVGMYVLTYGEVNDIIHGIKVNLREMVRLKTTVVGKALLLILLIQIIFNLAGASVLPSGWDNLGEHLAIAKEWTRLHRLASVPYINFAQWAQPFNVGILYVMALLLKDVILANLINFVFGLLTAVGIYALGKRYFSHRVGLFAAAIFYMTPMVSWLSTVAYVDLGVTFYAFLAFYALINWTASGKKGWLFISAMISGLALGSKYGGLLSVVILSPAILVSGWFLKKERFLRVVKDFFVFITLTGLIGSFWYIRAYIITGRPIFGIWQGLWYQFWRSFSGIWTSGLFDIGTPQIASALNLSLPRKVVSLPWNITMHGSRHADFAGIGVVFLAFLPLLLFPGFRRSKLIKFMLYYSAAYFIFWAVGAPLKRYLIPIFPLLGIMVAYVVEQMSSLNKFVKSGLYTLLILSLIFQVFYLAPEGLDKVYQRLTVFVGLKSQQDYVWKNEETYPVFNYINGCLPIDSKLFIANDPRNFYCDRPYVTEIMKKGRPLRLSSFRDSARLLAEFKKAEITHLVINRRLWGLWEPAWLEDLKEKHLQALYDEHHFQVFRIRYE